MSPFTDISILFWEGIIKKFIWASRLWVGRRKEPIFGYVPINDENKNLVHKGLNEKKYIYCFLWFVIIWQVPETNFFTKYTLKVRYNFRLLLIGINLPSLNSIHQMHLEIQFPLHTNSLLIWTCDAMALPAHKTRNILAFLSSLHSKLLLIFLLFSAAEIFICY